MKYEVRRGHSISYPDGGERGLAGYVIDSDKKYERETVAKFAACLRRVDRSVPASPVDLDRLMGAAPAAEGTPATAAEDTPAPAPKKKAKKKAKKKGIINKLRGSTESD